ncbi:MAG: protein-methionine-sulfoxide reductase heme-binding subunit MsrQ [Bauldia sp.]
MKSRTAGRMLQPPWLDRAGRFSWLKAATLALCCLPALKLAAVWIVWGLGPRPLNAATHETGDWAVRFILITLAVTPARFLFEWPRLIVVRRLLGLTAFAYALIHFSLYIVDQNFNPLVVVAEIASRIYLTIGFAALAGLAALAATSTDAAIKRLGQRWNTLHRLVYIIAALALIHDFMQTKLDVTTAVFLSGYFAWLMGYRALRHWRFTIGPPLLLALAVVAGLATALFEVGWYSLTTGRQPLRLLAAQFDFSFEYRPAWWVLAAGIGVLVCSVVWRAIAPGRSGRPSQARGHRRATVPSETPASNG